MRFRNTAMLLHLYHLRVVYGPMDCHLSPEGIDRRVPFHFHWLVLLCVDVMYGIAGRCACAAPVLLQSSTSWQRYVPLQLSNKNSCLTWRVLLHIRVSYGKQRFNPHRLFLSTIWYISQCGSFSGSALDYLLVRCGEMWITYFL